MLDAGGGGAGRVLGANMQVLKTYSENAKPEEQGDWLSSDWQQAREYHRRAQRVFEEQAKATDQAFEESSHTATAMRTSLIASAEATADKVKHLDKAISDLWGVQDAQKPAQEDYNRALTELPGSIGPAPSSSDPEFRTSGIGIDSAEVQRRSQNLVAAQRQHAADVAMVEKWEKIAAEHRQTQDAAFDKAGVSISAVNEKPAERPPAEGGATGGSGSGWPAGSRSAYQAAQARYDSHNSGTLYAAGSGEDIRAQARAEQAGAVATNMPEWDASEGRWVSADGSAAPVTEYASLVSSEGMAPLSGNAAGLSAGAVALGAGLGAGAVAAAVAAAAKAGILGGPKAAMTTGSQVAAKSTAGSTATNQTRTGAAPQRTNSAGGPRSGAGQAGRTGGKGLAGSGSREQMKRNAGTGAGGGKGAGKGRKNDKKSGQHSYQADYASDYSDESYEEARRFEELNKRDRSRAVPPGPENLVGEEPRE